MNTRQKKKQSKRKREIEKAVAEHLFQVRGNNGGDLFEVQDLGDGMILLSSGSCCVYTIHDWVVPVEFLTGVIEQVMLAHNMSIDEVIDSFKWEQSFKDKLKSKCIRLNGIINVNKNV